MEIDMRWGGGGMKNNQLWSEILINRFLVNIF